MLGEIYIKDRRIEEKEYMSGDNYNFYGNTQFNKELKGHATANQYINLLKNEKFNKKLEKMFTQLNETQIDVMRNLTDEFLKVLDEKLTLTNNFSEEQIAELETAKLSSDWKFKLKVGLPLASLTGITAEVEKEWKSSKEIKPDSIISFLRKFLRHEELNQMKLNQLEENNYSSFHLDETS